MYIKFQISKHNNSTTRSLIESQSTPTPQTNRRFTKKLKSKKKKKKPIIPFPSKSRLHASKDRIASNPWPNANSSSPRFPIARIFPSHSSIPTNTAVGSRLPITRISPTMSQHLPLPFPIYAPHPTDSSTMYSSDKEKKHLSPQSNPTPLSIPSSNAYRVQRISKKEKEKKNNSGEKRRGER